MCPPGLHITLGIFYRLFKLFEEACHELDAVAHFKDDVGGASFVKYSSSLREQNKLKEEEERIKKQVSGMEQLITVLGLALPNADSHLPYQQLVLELRSRKDRLQKVVSTKFMVPFCIPLLDSLVTSGSRDRKAGESDEEGVQ